MRFVLVAILSLFLVGCYHATIDTGVQPSGQTIENKWAHGFLYGLVPPSTVETAAECSGGVARVETQMSFLNQIAYMITFGIYSPMTITVACAGSGSAAVPAEAEVLSVSIGAPEDEIARAFDDAARRSGELKEPVFVTFR
jgi:hypothetical protein